MASRNLTDSVVWCRRHSIYPYPVLKVCKVFKRKDLSLYLEPLLSTEARLDGRAFIGSFPALRITGASSWRVYNLGA
jgi:hypothetical protein